MRICLTIIFLLWTLFCLGQKDGRYPDFIVDRPLMVIDANGPDPLLDVDLFTWVGAIPDSVSDTLRFFARHGRHYVNENYVNRWHCAMIALDLMDNDLVQGVDQGMITRDSLAMIYPEIPIFHLNILHDTVMRFMSIVDLPDLPGTWAPVDLKPLRELVQTDHWYLFVIYDEGVMDASSGMWYLGFYLDGAGRVNHWHNTKKIFSPEIPGTRKL